MSAAHTIFYSWQSDLPNKTNRGFIEEALKKAIINLARSETVIESERPELRFDKDTTGTPGSPDIAATILHKIDGCAIFVADLSTIGHAGEKRRPTANPNVLFELGYAWRSLSTARILMICNSAYSTNPERPSEDLPFDVGKHRVLFYSLKEEEPKAEKRKALVAGIEDALKSMIPALPVPPVVRPSVSWQQYVAAELGPIVYHHELWLDYNNDGDEEPLVLVETQKPGESALLQVLLFQDFAGGRRRIQVEALRVGGGVYSGSAELHFLTDSRRPDICVTWNSGGTGSWIAILRWTFAGYQVATRTIEGMTEPLNSGPRSWTLHSSHWVSFRRSPDSDLEEIVQLLQFDSVSVQEALDLLPLLRQHQPNQYGSYWIERIWRWDGQSSFRMVSQQLGQPPY